MDHFQALQDGLAIGMSLVLFLMTGLMYFRWKNRLYLNFTGAALLAAISSMGMAIFSHRPNAIYLFFVSLFTCGFVMQQINSFRLFHTKRDDKLYFHLGATFLSVLTAAASLFLPLEMTSLLLLLIVSGLGFYCVFKLFEDSAMRMRNSLTIGLFAVYVLCLFIWGITKVHRLLLFGNLFLILSLLVMFTLLFERIVGIMQAATYTSTRDEISGLFTRKHFMQQAQFSLNRKQARGLIYIDIALEEVAQTSEDNLIKNVGTVIRKYTSEYGFSGRYHQGGITVLITKPDVEIGDLAERIRMRLETELPGGVFTGIMLIGDEADLERVIEEAKKSAERSRLNGMNKVYGLEQSRILTDGGV
ncbi:hypothetical protein [Paenibacillus sp. Marseille-P2973]|uniref:hypothetical protein n=1 Tax=Paenibacillus sp. Marseille-P2973 TaxID=1871032 RepID=UPI001B3846E7|nr:hypothetical protein [Paenibacillus sp. Marseille-P2973]